MQLSSFKISYLFEFIISESKLISHDFWLFKNETKCEIDDSLSTNKTKSDRNHQIQQSIIKCNNIMKHKRSSIVQEIRNNAKRTKSQNKKPDSQLLQQLITSTYTICQKQKDNPSTSARQSPTKSTTNSVLMNLLVNGKYE